MKIKNERMMLMSNKMFMRVEDVAEEMGVSVSYAYKLIRKLNKELQSTGCITIPGRIDRKFFHENFTQPKQLKGAIKMGAFKNEKNGTWYVQFRYTDWQGLRQQKLKRGFATKREAQEWERAFLTEKKADVTMPFKTFTELYEKDVRPKLKENTWLTKEHIIKTKILPYFEHKRLCDISAKDVIAWQNEIRKMTNSSGEPFSQGYLKTIHNQLSSLFNHAIKIYGLRLNPASTVSNMGKEERKEMSYWTVDESSKFSDEMMDKPISYYAFQMLY